jgi:glucose/arabinose dehydrogenase
MRAPVLSLRPGRLATAALAAPPAPDADNGSIKLPEGFRALVVADELGPLRHIAVAASGDIYVKTSKAGIIALRDTDGDGRADQNESFGGGGGTGIALRDGWLYHSTNKAVYRYKLTGGQLAPKGEPETVVSDLPDEKQHEAKAFAFDDTGRLYVEVGSPANALGDPDRAKGAKGKDPTDFLKTHGGFWRFDPNTPNQKEADGFHYSTGHRHIMAIAWNPVSKTFFTVMNGRDQLSTVDPVHYNDDDNAELPAEEMQVLREGSNFGWPMTYWDPLKKARMLALSTAGTTEAVEPGSTPTCRRVPAHWAPMQMTSTTASSSREVPRRRLRGLPRIVEPRAKAAEGATTSPSCRSTTRAWPPERTRSRHGPNRDDFTNPRDARYRSWARSYPDGSLTSRTRGGPHLAHHLCREKWRQCGGGRPRSRRRRRPPRRPSPPTTGARPPQQTAPSATCPTAAFRHAARPDPRAGS